MPETTAFVTGTGTEVGKTWLTARVGSLIRENGLKVAARKPVMSFDVSDGTTDAEALAHATGETELEVCPSHRRYELPMAPPMAAEILGRPPFTIDDLLGEMALPPDGLALIEGVGGPRSPLAYDGDSVAFIDRLKPEHIVLVAPSGLGAINDVLTSCDALGRAPVVFLNRFEPDNELQVRNLGWLRDRAGLTVCISPEELVEYLVSPAPNNLDARSRSMEVQ